MEEWKDGRMEGGKNGRMEEWKRGRMEGLMRHTLNIQKFRLKSTNESDTII